MLQKVAKGSTNLQETFINTQVYLSLERANHTEKSNLDVMDVKSDSKDTLMSMLQNLHQQFVSRQGREYLVEGDAKLYELRYSSMGITFPSTIQGVHSDYGLQGRKMEILDTVCFCGCHGFCQSIFCYPQWGLAPEGK